MKKYQQTKGTSALAFNKATTKVSHLKKSGADQKKKQCYFQRQDPHQKSNPHNPAFLDRRAA